MVDMSPYMKVFTNRRIAAVMLFGFSSGLPLALTSGTLQAWMASSNIDIKTIGMFTLVGLPYTFKFLWAPIMDRFVPPFLGRRRGWAIITQLALIAGISAMALNPPDVSPMTIGAIALFVAFMSASQDIVTDAYRTDILHEKERGAGAAVFVLGYRAAMIASGGLALILSDSIGWRYTYLAMAGLMSIGLIASITSPQPDEKIRLPRTMSEAVVEPLKNFFTRESVAGIILLLVLYKLGDAYAGALSTAFLIKGMGFTVTEVGLVNKWLGMASVIIGALFGGSMMVKLGLFRSLFIFGLLQAVSNLAFMALAAAGKSYELMIFSVVFENLSSGMGTAAFVSLLMSLCDHRYSATQYALLSSLAVVGKYIVGPTAGFVAESTGWPIFFFITFITALPGLAALLLMRETVEKLDTNSA